ncbi:MAG TPA: SpoIID/LytB domain-containing protein [Blastocatellia bacterium]|nr:SpoIID/LytB domain-containing protein [Blastocatellia bacterium]
MRFKTEPAIKVGLIEGASEVRFTLAGNFVASAGETFGPGDYLATATDKGIRLSGEAEREAASLSLSPSSFETDRVTIHDITIGIDFHWQRKEALVFQGALTLAGGPAGILVINELPLESYLVSVISSEMRASCPPDLLRAHSVVSRGWLLAQLERAGSQAGAGRAPAREEGESGGGLIEVIRWYDRENHSEFDVCADDHCQRYQGISRAFSDEAFDAIRATRGTVLTWDGQICDTRYSKSCGGMTESFKAAWEDKNVPYLSAVYDGREPPDILGAPLTGEPEAGEWIAGSPEAFCNTNDRELLSRILPGFDQETEDFFRWDLSYTQEELAGIVESRTGLALGRIRGLVPLERGESGRIIRLKVVGERKAAIIGKELEIRRALSRSHLYSSAFVVREEGSGEGGFPLRFNLRGAGWGHGVGLCQIGAAVMAEGGYSHEAILKHYFRGAELEKIY